MTAMILAAGKGTRLKPLTNKAPKALVKINGKTMLENAVEKIKAAGISDIVINVHSFADMIIDYLEENRNFGINIQISDERDELLDTGGGIKKASCFFKKGEDILIYNADVISDIDLNGLARFRKTSKAVAVLAVRKRNTSRSLLFSSGRLVGKYDVKKDIVIPPEINPEEYDRFGFSGIHVISPDFVGLIEETGVFSITDVYLRLAAEHKIVGYDHSSGKWKDCGRYDEIKSIASI